MANIEINGIPLQVADGQMVIEAADEAGITIPRFCYHKKLSVAANCRMCLVEVEKAPKPLPACATPVTDGMKIFTQSPRALEAQQSVMEFLLVNHPLDCPICDQGGECDLQDIAMGFGNSTSRYTERKRVVADKDIGPLISTEMTRCIHCTRCVRFGQEIAGIMELGATGRGEDTRIATYVARTVDSEMSGNVIDLCPVGALTSKPYRYSSRPWENTKSESIAAHDCIGSNVIVETRRNEVMRVLPKENESINEMWLSDRDRYSYLGLQSADRLEQPMIKQGDSWKFVDWQTALNYAVEGLKTVIEKDGVDKVGGLISPNATTEEMYLMQKLLRGLGVKNIDHRLRQSDFADQASASLYPSINMNIADLENVNAALLVGSYIRKDQPIAAHRLRKANRNGATMMAINPLDYDFNLKLDTNIISAPSKMVTDLAAVAKALIDLGAKADGLSGIEKLINSVLVNDEHKAIAKSLSEAENAAVILGTQASFQSNFSSLRALSFAIAKLSGCELSELTDGANSAGAWLAGAVPHRTAAGVSTTEGLHAYGMTNETLNAYLLFNVEPEFDCASSSAAMNAISESDFVVNFSSFATDAMKSYSDVLLPITAFTETAGSFVNAQGTWQSFNASVTPEAEIRPGWKVLRVLGNLFEVDGFDFVDIEEVRSEIQSTTSSASQTQYQWSDSESILADTSPTGIERIGFVPIYSVDSLTRRSQALQATNDMAQASIIVSPALAKKQGLVQDGIASVTQKGGTVSMSVIVDEGVADNSALVAAAIKETNALADSYGCLEITAS